MWTEYGRVMQSLEIRSFLPVEEVKLPENLTGGRADLSGVNSEKGREKKKVADWENRRRRESML